MVLHERLDVLKEKTPEINELHTDGAYGNGPNDQKMAKLGIKHIQTAVRGRKPEVPLKITPTGEPDAYQVSCPRATVASQRTRKRFKAVFSAETCRECPHAGKCPTEKRKAGCRVFYFDAAAAAANVRNRNIQSIPADRRTLRANVEATIKQFTAPFNHKGKLKVRGAFGTSLVVFAMAIAINFGRVRRALVQDDGTGAQAVSKETSPRGNVKQPTPDVETTKTHPSTEGPDIGTGGERENGKIGKPDYSSEHRERAVCGKGLWLCRFLRKTACLFKAPRPVFLPITAGTAGGALSVNAVMV